MIRNTFFALLISVLVVSCGGGGGGAATGGAGIPPVSTTPTIITQRVFPNLTFNQPVALFQAPGDSSRWFVIEKSGIIRVFNNDQAATGTGEFLNINGRVNASGEGGLLGLAFHPNFPVTPDAYVSYTRSGSPLVSYISRFSSTDTGQTLNAATETIVMTVNQPDDNHNGGDIAFGPDNFLYVALGDGGGSGDPDGNGQMTSTRKGAILRLDIEGGSPYGIPPGNPFEANAVCTGIARADPCPEIYAWGFRNPWRFSFDTVTSKLWAADVGQGAWEEIDVVEAGSNYGWNTREGAHCFSPASGCADTFVEPISEYDHSLGASVTGGFVYRGTAIPDLVGWYLFGDFGSGRIFGIPEDSVAGVTPTIFDESGLSIVSFGRDTNGEMFFLDYFAGTIHQIVDAP